MSQAGFGNGCGCTAAVPNTDCTNTACINKQTFNIEVDIWDDPGCDGDNVVRVYNTNDVVYLDGYFYFSLEDMNVDMPPTAKWSQPYTLGDMLKPSDVLFLIDSATGKAIIGTDGAGDLVLEGDCFVTCNDLPDTSDHLTDTSILPNTVQLGVDGAGSPVMGGDCLITCNDFDASDFTIDPATGVISAAGGGSTGLTTVATDATLTGDGTSGSPLSVVASGGSTTVVATGVTGCQTLPAGLYQITTTASESGGSAGTTTETLQFHMVDGYDYSLEQNNVVITTGSNQVCWVDSQYNGSYTFDVIIKIG